MNNKKTYKNRNKKKKKEETEKKTVKSIVQNITIFVVFLPLFPGRDSHSDTTVKQNLPAISHHGTVQDLVSIDFKECTMKYFSRVNPTMVSVYSSINGTDRAFRPSLSALP